MSLFKIGKKKSRRRPAGMSDAEFQQRWQELVDQSELVETPEEVAGIAKSLTALVGERMGISKAIPSPGNLDDEIEDEQGDDGEEAEDDESSLDDEGGDDEGDDEGGDDEAVDLDEDEYGNDGDDKKTVTPAKKSKGNFARSATPAVEAPGAPGISKAVAGDDDIAGVDAGPIFEALVDEIANVHAGTETITKSLSAMLNELRETRTELNQVRGELEDLRAWREDADEKQDGIAKSMDALLSRGKGTPQGRARINDGAIRNKDVPALEHGADDDEAVEENPFGISRGDIIKGLHAHLMAGNNEKFKTGVADDVISRFDHIKPAEMGKLAEVAQKQLSGEFDGDPGATDA